MWEVLQTPWRLSGLPGFFQLDGSGIFSLLKGPECIAGFQLFSPRHTCTAARLAWNAGKESRRWSLEAEVLEGQRLSGSAGDAAASRSAAAVHVQPHRLNLMTKKTRNCFILQKQKSTKIRKIEWRKSDESQQFVVFPVSCDYAAQVKPVVGGRGLFSQLS